MKKTAIILALATMLAPTLGRAQVAIDMGTVTCGDYTAMSPELAKAFSAWMSGWFNQKNGSVQVNLDAFHQNVDNVRAWCANNKASSVMGGLQAAKMPK